MIINLVNMKPIFNMKSMENIPIQIENEKLKVPSDQTSKQFFLFHPFLHNKMLLNDL